MQFRYVSLCAGCCFAPQQRLRKPLFFINIIVFTTRCIVFAIENQLRRRRARAHHVSDVRHFVRTRNQENREKQTRSCTIIQQSRRYTCMPYSLYQKRNDTGSQPAASFQHKHPWDEIISEHTEVKSRWSATEYIGKTRCVDTLVTVIAITWVESHHLIVCSIF